MISSLELALLQKIAVNGSLAIIDEGTMKLIHSLENKGLVGRATKNSIRWMLTSWGSRVVDGAAKPTPAPRTPPAKPRTTTRTPAQDEMQRGYVVGATPKHPMIYGVPSRPRKA